ncbi:TPA: hypothetical protein ACPJQJ_001749, partial [Haemophilus influenzae]
EFNYYENEHLNKIDQLFEQAKSLEERKEILEIRKKFIEMMQGFELQWLTNQLEFQKQEDKYLLERNYKR